MNKFTFITDRDDFKNYRAKTIGASDIVVIAGLSKFKTPYQLWKEKTGRYFQDKKNKTAAFIGQELEGIILSREVADLTDAALADKFRAEYYNYYHSRPDGWRPNYFFCPFTRFQHPEFEFLSAHPDCVASPDRSPSLATYFEEDIIIEVKSGRRFPNLRREGMDGYDKNDNSENGVPLAVYLQTQFQSLVTGVDNIHVRALIDTNEELRYQFQGNKKAREKLIKLAARFWWHVKKDRPPAPYSYGDIKDIFPAVKNEVTIVGAEKADYVNVLADRRKILEKRQANIKAEIEDIKNSYGLLLGDKKYLITVDGRKIASQVMSENQFSPVYPDKIKRASPRIFEELSQMGLIKTHTRRYIT